MQRSRKIVCIGYDGNKYFAHRDKSLKCIYANYMFGSKWEEDKKKTRWISIFRDYWCTSYRGKPENKEHERHFSPYFGGCMTVALFFVVKHHLADKSPRMKLRVGWDRKLFLVIILSVSFFYFLPTMTKHGRNHCNQHELLCCDEMKLPEINQIIGLFIVYILSANISVFVQSIQHPHPTTTNWIFYKNTLEQMMDIIQWSLVYYKF